MQTINRDLFIITPKQPLINWINNLDPNNPLTLDDCRGNDNADVYLIPEFESDEMALSWLKEVWDEWFDMLLNDWWTAEEDWPQNRNWIMFNDFFEISYQSMVFDTQHFPVVKEDLELEEDDQEYEQEEDK